MCDTELDYKKLVENYINSKDWRVKENSTIPYSLGGLVLGNSGAVIANYWLSEIYPKEIADMHRNCEVHIHDLSMLAGYCAGWSLKQLIMKGLTGVEGKVSASPAKHLSTLCNQMVNFLGIMQNEWAGAQAFSSFDTYLAPFVKVDHLSYEQVKQCLQNFVFGVNIPSRWGTQAPFTNITLDWTVPNDMANLNCLVGGKEMNFCYKDCKPEMDMVNKAFIELMIEGDSEGRGFQYPIPTYSITKDFDWSETENNKLLFQMTAKYGTPYFSNYINSDMQPSDVRSMCVMPETKVRFKIKDQIIESTIKDMYNNYKTEDIKILTKFGYRHLKEKQRFSYNGDMIRITTEGGKELVTTPDHPHIVVDEGDNTYSKKLAQDLKVGDRFTCIPKSYFDIGKESTKKKGRTVESYYGEEKGKQLREIHREAAIKSHKWVGEDNPNFNGCCLTQEQKEAKNLKLKGHKVSEVNREKYKNHWLADKNPHYEEKANNSSSGSWYRISPYEKAFKEELDSLNTNYVYQYPISGTHKAADFYIPEKNLIIELETEYGYDVCGYNDSIVPSNTRISNRVKELRDKGYNVLVFNPKRDETSYRKYINNIDTITKIEKVPYEGYVYDVEVEENKSPTKYNWSNMLIHTFYANGILTSNCCRLRLDLRELRKKSGGFFGSGESTGSIGVVTINMPHIAYLSKDKEDFYKKLDHIMDLSAESLKIKRDVITKLLDKGLYPYTKEYLGTFKNHFSTIGLVGMNEACLNANWLKKDISNPECIDFTKEVLNHMRTRLSDYQEKYGDLYNLEATPAESTAYRLAKHDKVNYPDIITAGTTDSPYYTNSTNLPVGYTEDIFKALDIQDNFQPLYTSGTVFHTFLGQRLPNWKTCMQLVRKIAENYKLPYYTMSPTYSVCPKDGYITGEVYKCPKCGATTEVYSRITGYYRPVQNWNIGKTEEFKERKVYNTGSSSAPAESMNETVEEKPSIALPEEGTYLFGTSTCPNCHMAKILLDKKNLRYKWIEVDTSEENEQLARDNNITTAPTLIHYYKGTLTRYENLSNIKAFIEK